ncbi:hypothetical protein V1508DRAFT_43129 [Lipomyces doorenjongii]|uniref:uncharacterized protein n=1 Tax=Lipomyces doorenjongii TaxID=383834 RepID=UPI0034CD463A
MSEPTHETLKTDSSDLRSEGQDQLQSNTAERMTGCNTSSQSRASVISESHRSGSGSRLCNELGTDSAHSESHSLAKQYRERFEEQEQAFQRSEGKSGEGTKESESETKDLGWHQAAKEIHPSLVPDVPNELLWMLVRRFNKQIYNVRAIDTKPAGGIDLNISDKEEFDSPAKIRTGTERLYMTVFIGVMDFWHHMARLRTWKEWRRTLSFCVVYFACWWFDILLPMFWMFLTLLTVCRSSRSFFFPPEAAKLIEEMAAQKKTTTLGPSGGLGSAGPLTGMHELHKGEAAEMEAENFAFGLTSVATKAATRRNYPDTNDKSESREAQEGGTDCGTKNQTDTKNRFERQATISDILKDPVPYAMSVADNAGTDVSWTSNVSDDDTKKSVEEALWLKMQPAMHAVTALADVWERLVNALSPTPPFPPHWHRLRLASIFLVILTFSCYVTSYQFMKFISFCVGAGFFGDPVITRALDWINLHFPRWKYYIQLRNNILIGVPTNAQLTVTLLRVGEGANSPLPPQPKDMKDDKSDSSGTAKKPAGGTAKTGATKLRLLVATIRNMVSSVIRVALAANAVTAKVAPSWSAKEKVGLVPTKSDNNVRSGPEQFRARHLGKPGYVYISSDTTGATAGFVDDSDPRDPKEIFRVAVCEITELRKVSGFGWKSDMVVGWALQQDVREGLEIYCSEGKRYFVNALDSRDALFNRLLAIGGQVWEAF